MITDEATLLIKVDGDEQEVTFDVVPVHSYDIILATSCANGARKRKSSIFKRRRRRF
jgi:hypothetical protein